MRSTARKIKIEDLVHGEYVQTPEGEPNYLTTPWDQELLRVNIIATITDNFVRDDGDYGTLTLDDGSETIRAKAWGEDVENLERFEIGDLVKVVGKVREYEGEIHLVPEIVKEVENSNWELVRELEILEKRRNLFEQGKKPDYEKESEEGVPEFSREKSEAKDVGTIEDLGESGEDENGESEVSEDLKDKLLLALDKLEGEDGASLNELTDEINESESKTEEVIGVLLNEDKVYEPIAGKFKRLG